MQTPSIDLFPKLKALWQEAFGDTDAYLAAFEKTAFHPERCRVIMEDGIVCAALYWFDCSCEGAKIAYIYAVATLKACRGRGLCHRLMQDVHTLLAARGYAACVLVPGSGSLFTFYERMGYRTFGFVREFESARGQTAAELFPIEKEEYARLRRQYLPTGGIVQENENLDFLQTQAELYCGDGFVLAARKEEDTVFGIELLGDTRAASGIVTALGAQNGKFRTAGEEKPFAMYYPLREDFTVPRYFGLAFD